MELQLILLTVLSVVLDYARSQLATECGPLPVISNLEPIDPGNPPYPVGKDIKYNCRRGYVRLDGNNKAICQQSSSNQAPEWVKPTLTCTGVRCGEPRDSPHSKKIGYDFTFPNNVTYVCDEGYKMRGTRATLYCLPNGNWSIDVPQCEIISCGELPSIENGYVKYEPDTNYGSKAIYECNSGFKLSGMPKRDCLSNGTWTGKEPTCEISSCEPHSLLLNGRIIHNANVTKVGALVIFQCNAPGSTPATIKCLPSGEWTDNPPNCPALTTNAPSFTPTTETDFKQSTPEATTGPSAADGGSKGGESIKCGDPGPIENGYLVEEIAFPTNRSVSYRCVDGFNLKGPSTLTCLPSGIWNASTLPRCQKKMSIEMIIGIVVGVVCLLILIGVGVVFYLKKRKANSPQNPGLKNKAQAMDAKHVDEIRNLERNKKPIPVTSL